MLQARVPQRCRRVQGQDRGGDRSRGLLHVLQRALPGARRCLDGQNLVPVSGRAAG